MFFELMVLIDVTIIETINLKKTTIMEIKNIQGMTNAQIQQELNNGAKFVMYQYCISLLVMTFKRGSNIYFIRAGESTITPGLKYTFLSLILGWWGFPFGLIYTPYVIGSNLTGGKDVTQEVLQSVGATRRPSPTRPTASRGTNMARPATATTSRTATAGAGYNRPQILDRLNV